MSRTKKRVIKITLLAIVAVFLSVNLITKQRAKGALKEYAGEFAQKGTPNATEISMPKVNLGVDHKKPHGVLLIHGIPASTSTFAALCDSLDDKGFPYYAPMLTGFGNTELNLLPHVSRKDWLRDALNGYDILSQCVDEVSIVSTSTGAMIATWISNQREVRDLVFVVPNFEPGPSAATYKVILDTPVASQAFQGLMPYKFSDPEDYANKTRFRYPFYEVHSIREMFRLQDEIGPEDIRAGRGAYILSAARDVIVSDASITEALGKKRDEDGIRFESFEFDSAHAILQGDASEAVVAKIVEILSEAGKE